MGTNPWRGRYVELTEDYSYSGKFAGSHTKEKQLMAFLKIHIGASDIPDICPPDDPLPNFKSPLTKANTFLLLDWIRNLRSGRKLVEGNFLTSIKEGCWLRTCLGDSTSCSNVPPSQSFLLTTSDRSLLQNGSEMVDIPLVDVQFYGSKIIEYKEELKAVGVMCEFREACEYMGKRLMSLAASSNLTKSNVFSILKFIRLLREKIIPLDGFINTIKNGNWLKTRHGDLSPVNSILFDSEWKVASQISNLPLIDSDYYGEEISGFREELKLLGVKVGFEPDLKLLGVKLESQNNYQIVADFFRMPASLSVEATFLILECVRHANSSTFLKVLKDQKWLNTGVLRSPSECFLVNGEWRCLLKVFNGFPSISEEYYGPTIVSYKNELKKLGVVVDFDEAANVFARQFKQHAASSSITKENVLSFLSCYRQLKKTSHQLPNEVIKCLREEKWLQTRLGTKAPTGSILFHTDWEYLTPIVSLPFIDDSDTGYGREILEYRDELKVLGVVAEFSSGMQFVVSGLNIPPNPSDIAPQTTLSLMNCIRILSRENSALLDEFLGCLERIGVKADVKHECSLIASHLESQSEFTVISRIYKCLSYFNWGPQKGALTKEPANEASAQIFIPNGSNRGRWVCPEECVLHDKDDIFGLHLNVLEKHYEKDLLDYFSSAFGVRKTPNANDCCNLWNKWESTRQKLTAVECQSFWRCIAKHWNVKNGKLFSEKLLKLPVSSKDSDDVLLFDKDAIFIPDDLQLQDCFEKASPYPLFVWSPKSSFLSAAKGKPKLNEIFATIGVRTISESANKEGSSFLHTAKLKQIASKGTFIKRGLIRIILAFLADPSLEIEFEKRHQMVNYLLDLVVFETEEPITATYGLRLPTRTLKVDVNQMIRWEREDMKLYTQKVDRSSSGHKENIAYATYFSEVIAEGLLWEKPDEIAGLRELLQLGCLVEFEDEAISFLLKTKNLQLCNKDEEFIQSAFGFKLENMSGGNVEEDRKKSKTKNVNLGRGKRTPAKKK
ncbi:hypothetical protein MKW94_002320 [Papaver nudicaule]|uniref:Sacsin n=1 Tax=Papaver nudicaule TaxID=74823 RepID=A0AA41RWF6_PAPNU|nr:hypothetical protein [Papaver nudicaule]